MKDKNPLLRAITEAEQAERQWEVKLDGKLVPSPSLIELSSRFGLLRYGWTAGGYDGWTFRETNGGGVVVVPFALVERELLIGVIEEHRPNQGGKVLNAPRGFMDPGESHAHTAARELREETGLPNGEVEELAGLPMTPNSAFFETEQPGIGVRVFARELPASWLQRCSDRWEVSSSHVATDAASLQARAREAIGKLLFVPWTEAVMVSDMFTVAGVARLLGALRRSGRWPQ